jgi:hypothetical protein
MVTCVNTDFTLFRILQLRRRVYPTETEAEDEQSRVVRDGLHRANSYSHEPDQWA